MVDEMDAEPPPPLIEEVTGEMAPMEVTVIPDVQNKAEDPLKGEYLWEISNYSHLPDKHFSPTFELGGYAWQLLCFPRGNNRLDQLSLYLAVPDAEEQPLGWSRSAWFKLIVVDQRNPEQSIAKDTRHNFSADAVDWGFTAFCTLTELHDASRGLCVNDCVKIRVEVNVSHPDDYPYHDSREKTGFVGLKNQGATCYMNSLLQTLYNVNAFRKAVYHMPTSEDEEPSRSMPLALQSVFYKLQFTSVPVSTKDLTASFGWDSGDAFQQHDVQELNRILCDRLEEKMKGTRVEGTVNRLFEGQTLNYIDCINIDFKSSRKEAFQDLQLDVKGCSTIYDSFNKYCEVETLEGENKYEAEGYGKQDARKGVLFDSLPPVLNLHLKRFEYDYQKDIMVKINDRYEFYDELDLDKPGKDGKNPAYLGPNANCAIENKYKLLAVLVHSGGVHGGHYFAYIRPDGSQWLKFDDERVDKADGHQAVQENWGGDDERAPPAGYGNPLRMSRFSNAYMLVYVRESEWESVMCAVSETDISQHVRARLQAEQAEKERRRKERAEAHLYTLVRIATDADLKAQIGTSRYFDLVDFNSVDMVLKMSKKARFSEVQKEVESRLKFPVDCQRYWRWAERRNATFRPLEPLPEEAASITLAELQDAKGRGRQQTRPGEVAKLNLFLETPIGNNRTLLPLTKSSALLFFKSFTPLAPPRLEYIGRAIIPRPTRIGDLHKILRSRAGLPENAPIRVLEEVKFDPTVMVEFLKPESTVDSAELENGDILVVQEESRDVREAAAAEDDKKEGRGGQFILAESFLKYVRNRVTVAFRRLEGGIVADEEAEALRLDLLKDMSWDEISGLLAGHLKLDHPLKIRFTLQSPYTLLPRPSPARYNTYTTLEEMVCVGVQGTVGQINPTLFYEVIDLPLPEFERLVTHRIAFHNNKHEEAMAVTVRLPKDRSVSDLLEEVRAQLPAEMHGGAPLRLLEVYQWRIWQLFDPSLPVERHLDSAQNIWHVRAEVIPADQRDLDQEGHMHVHCLQVEDKESNPKLAFPFSDPFIMAVGPSDTVKDLKERVRVEMGLSEAEFAEWKVVLISATMNATQESLSDDVVIAQRLNAYDLAPTKLYGHAERQMLGFHHPNKNPRKTHAHLNRASNAMGQDRALKIRA